MILSIRPQINKSLQEGVVFSPGGINMLKKFNVTQIMGRLGGDYASVGLVLDDWVFYMLERFVNKRISYNKNIDINMILMDDLVFS